MATELKPLRQLNFAIIQEPLTGLLRNMDSDLQRRIQDAQEANNVVEHRQLTLLLIMLRFASNSYQAVGFLLSDLDVHPKRLPRFVLVVPSINRQIMDLWFTLIYMMDDFGLRSLEYEQYAYRQLKENIDATRKRYGPDPDWQDWFAASQELHVLMETQIPLTNEQKANPEKTIPSWPHPHALSEKLTKSQKFLQFLHELVYGDTSVEAHLKPAGLMMGAGILLADLGPEHLRKNVEERTIHQYKFRHFCRTVITLLGIISEIEIHCNLNNREQAVKIWQRLAEYNADAKDVFDAHYKTRLG
jgi:hypothetical protein